jgi:hypothetical protein
MSAINHPRIQERPMLLRGLGLSALILLGGCASGGGTGTTTTGMGAPPQFAGAFAGEVMVAGNRNPMLVIVHADGTMTSSDANDFEGASRGQFNSPGYGSWRQTGERTTSFTIKELEYDRTGKLLGTSTIQGTGNYSVDGREVTGSMQITTWRGQPGPAGLTYRMQRIEPPTP